METLHLPFSFQSWLNDNIEMLKPPVGNREIFPGSEFIVMTVGGPNSRIDFHIDPSEELFYQIAGTLTLKLFLNGDFKDVKVHAGEMFRLPAMVPHSPQRPADSVGIVIERKRKMGELDGFAWYCSSCKKELHSEFLQLSDIVKDLPPVFERFYNSDKSTCKHCGHKTTRHA